MKPLFHRLSGLTLVFNALLWPVLTWAQTANTNLENPLGTNIYFPEIWARLAGGLLFVTGTLALAVVIIGGYRILTAAGNAENFAQGKKMIVYAILGMFIAVGSYAILATAIGVLTGGAKPFGVAGGLVDPLNLSSDPQAAFTFYGGRLLRYALSALGAVSLLMAIYGGFTWLTSAGNEEKITTAKKTLTYAGIGLIIILTSYTFISFLYQPFYRMLSGQAPVVAPEQQVVVPPDKKVACFRKPLGQDYGATCEPETVDECNQKTAAKQKGEAYGQYTEAKGGCSAIGACAQVPPLGRAWRNRVPQEKCPEDNNGRKTFRPIAPALSDGTCNINGTTPINLGTGERKNIQCFTDVVFLNGIDLLKMGENEWACIRRFPDGRSQCRSQPASGIKDKNTQQITTPGCDTKMTYDGTIEQPHTTVKESVTGAFYER
ncbi:MAG: hypothetical protein HY974_04790, partial [Candidatus Kerfeldbacteria bacterium]|nr:hypothetical protein [Candidatus Kerfeldbacteria bacterium]